MSDTHLTEIAEPSSWTLPGVGMYGSDVEVVSLDGYRKLAARCANAEAACLMWGRKCSELEGRGPTRDFSGEALRWIAEALRLPVAAVLDALVAERDGEEHVAVTELEPREAGDRGLRLAATETLARFDRLEFYEAHSVERALRPLRSALGSPQSKGEPMCECENPERGLFIWRDDPEWWSCVQCEGRVRPLTEVEKATTPSYTPRPR